MKLMTLKTTIVFALLVLVCACNTPEENTGLPSWAIGPFERPEGVNPIITPQNTTFYCPLTADTIPWENGDKRLYFEV